VALPHSGPAPHLNVSKNEVAARDRIHCWPTLFRGLPVLRHKTAFFKGYITQDAESAEIFRGIDDVCQLFALQYFLSYKPLKLLWADPPTAMRVWVKSFGKLFQKKNNYSTYMFCASP
jgi:hypothetical protein